MSGIEKMLLWAVRIGLLATLLTPLIIAQNFFFPFITGKNFYFRIIVELLVGLWLALAILRPDYRPRRSLILISFSVFIAIVGAATIFGADPYHSFWSNFERMEGYITHLHVLALFFVVASFIKSDKEWFYLLNASLLVSLITAVYGFLQAKGVAEILGASRPYATFGNSIYFGVYLLFHLFIIVFFFWRVRLGWARIVYALLFLFEFYVFFIAASRGAFIGFVLGALFVVGGLVYLAESRRIKIAAGAIFLVIIGITLNIFYLPQGRIAQSNELFSRFASVSFKSLGEDPRIMIWGIALDAFRERPVLGWGPENFIIPYGKFYNSKLYGNEPWFDRAHNMLLEWLVAAGLVGLISYITIFALAAFTVRRLVRNNTVDAVSGILLGGFLVMYIVQNAFVFDNIVTYIYLAIFLAALHYFYLASQNSLTSSVKKNKYRPVNAAMLAAIIPVTIFVIYILNAKPIFAANQLIVALRSFSTSSSVEEVIKEFDKVTSYNTFGSTEARERLADSVVQVAFQVEQSPPQPLKVLLHKSIEELEKEATAQPQVAKSYVFLGKLYAIQVNWEGKGADKAEATYRKAIEIAPRYVQTHLGLAELYLITKRPADAIKAAQTAFEMDPESRELFYITISVYVLSGNFDGAVELLQRYVAGGIFAPYNPVSNDSDIKLMVSRTLASNDLKGRALFFEELDSGFHHPRLYVGLAQTYADLGNKSKASEYARKALVLDPNLSAEVNQFLQGLEPLP